MGWFEREEREIVIIDPTLSPMDYLLARMRDPTTEEHVRTRIAIALLPFTVPKLIATAHIDGKDFASVLERRIAHMRKLEAGLIPPPKERPPVEVKAPFPHVYDRRYRRI